MDKKAAFSDTGDYLKSLTLEHRKRIEEIMAVVKKEVPDAIELISYNMPAYKFAGRILVYMAAHRNHIGFYPASIAALKFFEKEIKDYQTSKGTLQFSAEKKIPVTLVKQIVKFRAAENIEKNMFKKIKKG